MLVTTLLITACAVDATSSEAEFDPVYVAAAEELCPILWTWQKNVGSAMNDMSFEARREDDSLARRALYLRAFDEIRELNAQLDATVVSLGDTDPLDRIVPDVRSGLKASNAILDRTTSTIQRRYSEFEAPSYGDIVPVIFLDIEKAIDVAKPEMASYRDDDLRSAFTSVAQCQHGVKDANDGIPRYVP